MHVGVADPRVGRRDHATDATTLDENGMPVEEMVVDKDTAIDERLGHHTVSVTLRRCGGMSGLRPRRNASAFAAR